MQIKKAPVKDLVSPEWNPRQITDEELEKLKTSLEEFGYIEPIIVNDVNNHVVGGNQRLRALIALGYDEVDCVYVHIEDINKEKACNVALNKISGDWDEDKLRVVLEDIELSPIDIKLTGFEELELTELEVKEPITVHEDDFNFEDEEDIEVNVKEGDLFKLGNHFLLCGDSTVKGNVDRLLDGAEINMVFTDPPYNALKSWKKDEAKAETRLNPNDWFENDNMTWEEYAIFLDNLFKSFKGHSVYICCDYRIYPIILEALAKTPYDLKHCIVWKKNVWGLGKRYRFQHEFIVYACKDKAPFEGDRSQSDVWEIDVDRTTDHKTPKPIALCAKAIMNSSKPYESVLDLCGGSGSTLMACEQLNRRCYMMELSPKYTQFIINRWEEYTGQKATKIN